MEVSLGNTSSLNAIRLIESIGVQRLIGDDVVLQQRLEILLAVRAEQERIDPGPEFQEGEIRGREEGAADVIRSVVQARYETGFGETELEGAEFAGEKADDVDDFRRWDQDAVDAVDDAVSSELRSVSFSRDEVKGGGVSYDVDGDDPAVEINRQSP